MMLSSSWRQAGQDIWTLLPFSIMFITILLINTVLRDTKDSLVIEIFGIETLATFKAWVIMPMSMSFCLVLQCLTIFMSKHTIFLCVVFGFVVYFVAFNFLVYPYFESDFASSSKSWSSWVAASTFYGVSEMWATVVLSHLFWSTATDYFTVMEAKRLFPILGMVGQLGLIIAGQVLQAIAVYRKAPTIIDSWRNALGLVGWIIALGGSIICMSYIWISRRDICKPVATMHESGSSPSHVKTQQAQKKFQWAQLSQACHVVVLDPHVQRISLLVAAYGVSVNAVEICWRDAMGKAFAGDSVAYSQFMGQFWTFTGVATCFGMLCSHRILAWVGFKEAVSVTPLCLMATGVTFFGSLLLLEGEIAQGNPMIIVYIGAVQSLASKALKYSFFDITKELAFIPVPDKARRMGKMAIDVVGNRASKALGALLIHAVVHTNGSLAAAIPCLAGIFILVMGIWLRAAWQLGILVGNDCDALAKKRS